MVCVCVQVCKCASVCEGDLNVVINTPGGHTMASWYHVLYTGTLCTFCTFCAVSSLVPVYLVVPFCTVSSLVPAYLAVPSHVFIYPVQVVLGLVHYTMPSPGGT